MPAAATYQKTVHVMPILAGDKNPIKIAKNTKIQYVRMLISINLTLVDMICQLSNWNLEHRSATIITITIKR